MLTARSVLASGAWDATMVCDTISLDYDERHRRRFHYVAAAGTAFLLDLPRATVLRDGDALALSDGRLVGVQAAPEPLMEARAASPGAMIRLAWHIGNRHLPAELHDASVRLRRDHVIHAMLVGLGAEVTDVEAPFSPEQGAYAGGHGHAHQSAHSHDHHSHSDHGHPHDLDHAHDHHAH
jgi:urease accessory protein